MSGRVPGLGWHSPWSSPSAGLRALSPAVPPSLSSPAAVVPAAPGLPVHPSAGPFLPALSPWRRALPAAEHPRLATSSAAFVLAAFVSRLALAAGQARHPFQSSLCFIGAVAAQKSVGFNQGENTVFPRSPPSPGRAGVEHIAWQRAAGRGCASGHASDGQQQVGAGVSLLSPSPRTADISSHSQMCHFQHSPVLQA